MKIGSFFWRVRNYGLKPSVLYLFGKNSLSNANYSPVLNSFDQLEERMGIKDFKIDTSGMLRDLELSFKEIRLKLNNPNIKNVFEEPSFTRVLVLGFLIQSDKFSQIIESGTQNGVSTILISNLIKKFKANLEIHSIDVVNHPKISDSGIKYYVLNQPVRKNFRELTNKINLPGTIFFHDSDHTKENMKFEFDWAWNHLQVSALVSDDIESNSSFADFCRVNSLSPLIYKFDNGPCVGLVLRN